MRIAWFYIARITHAQLKLTISVEYISHELKMFCPLLITVDVEC